MIHLSGSYDALLTWSTPYLLLDYAGNPATFLQTCSGLCYEDWVLGPPSNFDTAYFEVQYVRVYGQPGELTILSSPARRSADITAMFSILLGVVAALFLAW